MDGQLFLIFIPLSLMACDHRALSLGAQESGHAQTDGQAAPQDDSRSPGEAPVFPTFCEGAASITGSLEGTPVELPYAFYGITFNHECNTDRSSSSQPSRHIKLLITNNPGECARLGDSTDSGIPQIPVRGVDLGRVEISDFPQKLEGWKMTDAATSFLDIDFRVEADLLFQRVPSVLREGPLSKPEPEDEVEGCVNLRFRNHSSTEGTGNLVGEAWATFRARFCPALFTAAVCWD